MTENIKINLNVTTKKYKWCCRILLPKNNEIKKTIKMKVLFMNITTQQRLNKSCRIILKSMILYTLMVIKNVECKNSFVFEIQRPKTIY